MLTLICLVYIQKGCDIDDVIDVAYDAMKNKKNVADELHKAFYGKNEQN